MNTVKSPHRSAFRGVALAAIVCLFGAAEAPAADPNSQRSQTVSYRDINLLTIEGATALYQRIKRAAHSVCDDPGVRGLESIQASVHCYQGVIAGAVIKVNSPLLTAVHGGKGRDAIVTALNSK